MRVRRALLSVPTLTYLGSIGILGMLFVLGLLAYAGFRAARLPNSSWLVCLGLEWGWKPPS